MPAHMEFTPLKSSCAQELHLLVLMEIGKVLIMALVVGFGFLLVGFVLGVFCLIKVEEALKPFFEHSSNLRDK